MSSAGTSQYGNNVESTTSGTAGEHGTGAGGGVKDAAGGVKNVIAGIHGAGEKLRGEFNAGVDKTFHEVRCICPSLPFYIILDWIGLDWIGLDWLRIGRGLMRNRILQRESRQQRVVIGKCRRGSLVGIRRRGRALMRVGMGRRIRI